MTYLKSTGPSSLPIVVEELALDVRQPSTAARSTMINLWEMVVSNMLNIIDYSLIVR